MEAPAPQPQPAGRTPPPEGEVVAERIGHVLCIGLNRPAKLNAFTPQMLDGLAAAYTQLEEDPEARCGLLHAWGRAFTAGNQLETVAPRMASGGPLFPPALVDPMSLQGRPRSKPLVAAVHGICFTVGVELMLAADIVVAADDCRFAQMEVRRGIFSNGGSTFRMVQRAGWGNAMTLLLTGREFDAQQALRFGFAQEVVPAGQAFSRAFEWAAEIAAQAPLAVQATLASARLAVLHGEATCIADLNQRQALLSRTEDVQEGLRSFLERRPARFQGR